MADGRKRSRSSSLPGDFPPPRKFRVLKESAGNEGLRGIIYRKELPVDENEAQEELFTKVQTRINREEGIIGNNTGMDLLLRFQTQLNDLDAKLEKNHAEHAEHAAELEKNHAEHAEHAAELEKKLMKHAGQLNLMRSYTLNEWAKTNIDTEDRFKRHVVAHGGDIAADLELIRKHEKEDYQLAQYKEGFLRGYKVTYDECVDNHIQNAPDALLTTLNMRANLRVMRAWGEYHLAEQKLKLLEQCDSVITALWSETVASPKLITQANEISDETFALGT